MDEKQTASLVSEIHLLAIFSCINTRKLYIPVFRNRQTKIKATNRQFENSKNVSVCDDSMVNKVAINFINVPLR